MKISGLKVKTGQNTYSDLQFLINIYLEMVFQMSI